MSSDPQISRLRILELVSKAKSSHIGSAYSCVDIIEAILSCKSLEFDFTIPNSDVFILSKGHAGIALYVILEQLGLSLNDDLNSFYQNESIFSGHVSHHASQHIPLSTGSLGMGLSVASGIAFSRKIQGCSSKSRIICLMSDGELNEGSNWEAFLFAAHHKLDNLVFIIDRNGLQSMKSTEQTLAIEPLSSKLKAFNLNVVSVDGHNHAEILSALFHSYSESRPLAIIASTLKGKGVSYMEDSVEWHYRTPTDDLYRTAQTELLR